MEDFSKLRSTKTSIYRPGIYLQLMQMTSSHAKHVKPVLMITSPKFG